MSLSQQISQLIGELTTGASQSSDSYGRTDGLTEIVTNPPLKSCTYVPHAHVQNDHDSAVRTAALRASLWPDFVAIHRPSSHTARTTLDDATGALR